MGGREIPDPYFTVLGSMSFMTLSAVEFVPVGCMYSRTFDHCDALLLESLVPLGLLLIAEMIWRLRSEHGERSCVGKKGGSVVVRYEERA